MRHIHFGSGALGLGFVLSSRNFNNVETTLVGREEGFPESRYGSLAKENLYQCNTQGGSSFPVQLSECITSNQLDSKLLSSADIITTSIGARDGAVLNLVDTLSGILENTSMQRESPLIFVAFENKSKASESIVNQIVGRYKSAQNMLYPCNVMVDSICHPLSISTDGKLQALRENFAQCKIHCESKDVIETIAKVFNTDSGEVLFVDDAGYDYAAYQKACLVNGIDYIIAASSYEEGLAVCPEISQSTKADIKRFISIASYAAAKKFAANLGINESKIIEECCDIGNNTLVRLGCSGNRPVGNILRLSDIFGNMSGELINIRRKLLCAISNEGCMKQNEVDSALRNAYFKVDTLDYLRKINQRLVAPLEILESEYGDLSHQRKDDFHCVEKMCRQQYRVLSKMVESGNMSVEAWIQPNSFKKEMRRAK